MYILIQVIAWRQGEAPSHTLCLWQNFLFITRCLSLSLVVCHSNYALSLQVIAWRQGRHPPIHCASGRIFCLSLVVCHCHSLFVTRTTHYWNIYHYETFHTLSVCMWSSNYSHRQNVWVHWSSYYNILQHLTRNIRESSSTFNYF